MRIPTPVRYVITALLAIFITFLAMDAHCEEVNVTKPASIYLSLSAADLASTEWAISHGAEEANGLMASHRYAKQAAMAGAFTATDVWLQAKGKKREARALRVVYAAFRVAAVAVNVRNARRAR